MCIKKRLLSFTLAISVICALTMTSCSAAESPAPSSGTDAQNAAPASETQGAPSFTDVPADAWYAQAVSYCRQHNIMNGTTDTAFAPEESLNRAMLAAVLYRAAGSPAVSDPPAFTDTAAGEWYSDAVSWAAKNGVISGYGDGTFGISDPATREQAAAILYRCAGSPESGAADDFSDAALISDWAKAAVRWADASGILDGMVENRRFDPEAHIKRGETASMLYHYLTSTSGGQPEQETGGKTLVAYFSATNTTRPLAEYAADILSADLFEIRPETPYTQADLAYYTDCRADREQNDPAARPAIAGDCIVADMADYDVVFIGYPKLSQVN